MIATDSLLTSEIEFRDSSGRSVSVPREWQPASVFLPVAAQSLADVDVRINGRSAPVSVVAVEGALRAVAAWDRSGPGWYEIDVRESGVLVASHRCRVSPSKIDQSAFESMLFDLEERLPVTIAIALRSAGARIGVDLEPPQKETLATELARLRRAVRGEVRPGLAEVLQRLADDPHQLLKNVGEWVRAREARRPDPGGLIQSIWTPNNLEEGRPKRVLDRRVVPSVDLYENRLLKAFVVEVERRLRRLRAVLDETTHGDNREEVEVLLNALVVARRQASFLRNVGLLRTAPGRATMVLMKRMEYRAAYEGFLEFRRRRRVYLDEPEMDEPLQNLPYLYQLWCTLVVLGEVVERMVEKGWLVASQRLVTPRASGMYLDVLRDGRPAVVMRDGAGRRLRVIPERSFGRKGSPLRSVSFSQRPDISIELTGPDGTAVLLLDPKYKLDSESDADPGDGTPKKVDVDKMHAYRDAIRDPSGAHVVRHAATLYPGRSTRYGDDVSAIRSYPGEESEMRGRVRMRVEELVDG